MNKSDRQKITNTALFTTGALVAIAMYSMGHKNGVKLDSMTKDLVAHQLIVVRLRAENPELVDRAVTETITQLNGLIAAAN